MSLFVIDEGEQDLTSLGVRVDCRRHRSAMIMRAEVEINLLIVSINLRRVLALIECVVLLFPISYIFPPFIDLMST